MHHSDRPWRPASLDFQGNLYDVLPSCFARAAAVPAGFSALSAEDTCKVLDYMSWAAADGTYCFANAIRNKPLPTEHVVPRDEWEMSFSRIYSAVSPMVRAACDRPPKRTCSCPHSRVPDQSRIRAYTDGSFTAARDVDGDFTPAQSGWGVCLVVPAMPANDGAADPQPRILEFCGPTIVQPGQPQWHGASRHSNNVAEVEAIIAACMCILQKCQPGAAIEICFDSRWAANMATQRWRARSNLELVRRAAKLAYECAQKFDLTWCWVKGHSDDSFNTIADRLVASGAAGKSLHWDNVTIVAPTVGDPSDGPSPHTSSRQRPGSPGHRSLDFSLHRGGACPPGTSTP